nr:hypothetical protein [Sunxiuqinia dokdonensis]
MEQSLPEDLAKISINDWNAHLFFINKRKCLAFVNNLTFYTVFLTDIQKKDIHEYQNLSEMRLVYENGLINNTPTGKLYEAKKSWSSPIENLNEMINPVQNQ